MRNVNQNDGGEYVCQVKIYTNPIINDCNNPIINDSNNPIINDCNNPIINDLLVNNISSQVSIINRILSVTQRLEILGKQSSG